MGILDPLTDRFGNRNLLTKTPISGNSGELSALDDDIETMTERTIIPEEIPDIEPTTFTKRLNPEAERSKLREISEEDIGKLSKSTSAMSDAELEPLPTMTEKEIPEIPSELAKPEVPVVSTPEAPKVEPQVETPKIPETITPVAPEAPEVAKPEGPGLVKQTLDYFGKRLPTKEELKESGKRGIMGTPSANDMEYARRGGYVGIPKETLMSTNDILSKRNTTLQGDIERINSELITLASDRKELYEKLKSTKDTADRAELNSELKRLDSEITKLEMRKQQIMTKIGENEDAIRKYNIAIAQYEEAVRLGRAKASVRGVVGKKLQALGEGAGEVSSGVYDKTRVSRDWFGQKGFLAQPFKQANITSSIVQPVRTRMSNLDAITRSTGSIVGRGMVDAVTTVRANKDIAPFGAPGTISGARKQFEYNVPAKRIVAAEVTTNINRDILPNIFSPPKVQAPTQQYTQVMQPDGTIMNVPVQQRKSKISISSVNRGIKHSTHLHKIDMNVKKLSPLKITSLSKMKNTDTYKLSNVTPESLKRGNIITSDYEMKTCDNKSRIGKATEFVGELNPQTAVSNKLKTPTFNLGLLKHSDMDIDIYEKTKPTSSNQYLSPMTNGNGNGNGIKSRKSKKSETVVSLLNVGKNLNKLVSSKKVKKV